jgi:hypothetical protein
MKCCEYAPWCFIPFILRIFCILSIKNPASTLLIDEGLGTKYDYFAQTDSLNLIQLTHNSGNTPDQESKFEHDNDNMDSMRRGGYSSQSLSPLVF